MLSFRHLLIILVIVLVVFGTKRLRSMGSDVGGAVKGFKDAMKSDDKDADFKSTPAANEHSTTDSDKKSP